MAKAVVNARLVFDDIPEKLEDYFADTDTTNGAHMFQRLSSLCAGAAVNGGRGLVRVDSATASGGDNPLQDVTVTATVGTESADDTIVIGGAVTLTWKVSASGENEVDIGGDSSASATNLAAKINAHSVLGKMFVASADAEVCSITYPYAGREGALISIAETGSTVTLSGSSFASGATEASSGDSLKFGLTPAP